MQGTKEQGGVTSSRLTDTATDLLVFLYSSPGVAGLILHLSGGEFHSLPALKVGFNSSNFNHMKAINLN